VPNAQATLDSINEKINNIIGKYEGATDVAATPEAAKARKATRDASIEETIEFAESTGSKIGKKVEVVENDQAATEMAKKLGIKKNVTGTDGFIFGDTIVINKDVAGRTGAISVGSHEILHGIMNKHMSGIGVEGRRSLIADFKKVLSKKQLAAVEKRLNNSYKKEISENPDFINTTDEWFTAFSDAIVKNEVTFDEGVFDSIKNFVHNIVRTFTKDVYKKEFKDGRAVYNFLKDYSQNVKAGKLSSRAEAVAAEGVTSETTLKKSMTASQRAEVKNEIDKLGMQSELGDNYRQEGGKFLFDADVDNVISEIKNKGYLDNLIAAKYKGDRVPVDFVDKVVSELTSHIKNFNPETNDSLFGWINSQLANKAGNVYNREYKATQTDAGRARDIGETTQEGEVKVQVAAETDTALEALETEDLSVSGQLKRQAVKTEKQSKFRRALGFETDGKNYNSVLDATRKSLLLAYRKTQNIKDASKRAIAIRELLRQEYFTKGLTSDLFKPIKNFLGAKTYIQNLRKHREAIVDALSTADLVQIERKIPENERIFTTFDRKLTSKQEVQDAVNKDLLPPDALNKIDKGQAVNLYKKRMPTENEFIAYADQPAINPETGARSGLKGTRKDGLAKGIANTLVLDATMEVRQSEDVVDRLGEDVVAELDVERLAAAIGREIDVKFSKQAAEAKYNSTKQLTKLQRENKALPAILKLKNTIQDKIFNNQLVEEDLAALGFLQKLEESINNGMKPVDAYSSIANSMPISPESLDINFNTIDEFVNYIKDTTLPEIREQGYRASIVFLENELSKIDNTDQQVDFIAEFLNIGRSIRTEAGKKTTKLKGLSTNRGLKENVLDVIMDGKFKDTFELTPTESGEAIKGVSLYAQIKNIKNNVRSSEKLRSEVNEQAIDARKLMFKVLDSDVLSVSQKLAMIDLMAVDQRGVIRKMYTLGASVTIDSKLPSSKLTLEHEIAARDMVDYLRSYAKGKISKKALNDILEQARVHVLPNKIDTILANRKLKDRGGRKRYQDIKVKQQLEKYYKEGIIEFVPEQLKITDEIKKFSDAIKFSRTTNESKGITILDFDDTLATSRSLVKFTRPDGSTGTLTPEQYAATYEDLLDLNYTFDFSEFNKVVDGKPAPLLNKAKKLANKFGTDNMFVLTARPPESASAIKEFLDNNGLNIPIDNITGLGNSTAEAKALWVAEKAADGYNDFYFADDALKNVQAVDNMLEQFDVKRKVQQAKLNFSKSLDSEFNNILQQLTGIEANKRFSDVKARKRGANKGKFRFFIPPSHEDFVGLLYNFLGKGAQGNRHRDFFERALVRPLNRAYRELDTAKQAIANDFKALNKKHKDIKNKLKKNTADGDFTFEDAIRVFIWSKYDYDIPGLSKSDKEMLLEYVELDPVLKSYANRVDDISRVEKYIPPTESWEAGDIKTDLMDATGKVGRDQYFNEFNENAAEIFSKDNLNKVEAGYGRSVREALEDMLYSIQTGQRRPQGQNKIVNAFVNFINASVGTVMFFNMRSSLLQQMSIVNYMNFADNNLFAMAKAFANQKQYWTDWAMIFNSDMLKQRRGGIQTDVNGAELVQTVSKSKFPMRTVIKKLLAIGFTPTQIGDSIAISTGGSTFYRNRVNRYLKDGLTQSQAEQVAFNDFNELTQATQQSAREDMISQQQRSAAGKFILAFQNVTSQFNRLGKKAFLDLKNRRISKPNETQLQSDISNLARLTYYIGIQNMLFYSLQTALFMAMFDDDDELTDKEKKSRDKKYEYAVNGAIDSVLRGTGVYGAIAATVKNMAIKWMEQREKKYNKDESAVLMAALDVSPPLGIKARRIVSAEKTLNYNEDAIKHMELMDIDNPIWPAVTSYFEVVNVPLNKTYNKIQNVRQSLNDEHEDLERAMMFFGWSQYNLGLENKKMEGVKQDIKDKEKKEKNSKYEDQQKEELRKARKGQMDVSKITCSAAVSSGARCKRKPVSKGKCTIHQEVELSKSRKKKQCRKIKSDGSRCKMMTESKSQLCYYHD